jgi:hypothetical protein
MMTLQDQLKSIKAKSAGMMTPEITAAMKQGFEELTKSRVLDKALKVGDMAPAFALPDCQGKMIHSQDLLAKSPLVILFFRGKW